MNITTHQLKWDRTTGEYEDAQIKEAISEVVESCLTYEEEPDLNNTNWSERWANQDPNAGSREAIRRAARVGGFILEKLVALGCVTAEELDRLVIRSDSPETSFFSPEKEFHK